MVLTQYVHHEKKGEHVKVHGEIIPTDDQITWLNYFEWIMRSEKVMINYITRLLNIVHIKMSPGRGGVGFQGAK